MYLVKCDGEIISSATTAREPYERRIVGGSIKKAINAIDSFTFTIYKNNPCYDNLNQLVTKIEVTNTKTNNVEFRGRVLSAPENMDESGLVYKTVTCEGELGYFCDSIQPYAKYINKTVRQFLEGIIATHNGQVSLDKRITLGIVSVADNIADVKECLYESTLDTINNQLIAKYGGEIQIRYQNGVRLFDYLNKIGTTKETEIKLARNLQSIARDIDVTAIVTQLYVFGAKKEGSEERIGIESVNDGQPFIESSSDIFMQFGAINGTVFFDDITDPAILKAKGVEWMNQNNVTLKKHTISAVDLSVIGLEIDSFEVGNTHRVYNPIMNVDEQLRIIEKTLNLDSPHFSTLTVGDKYATLTSLTASTTKQIYQTISKTERRTSSYIESKVANATALITGAEGGYVVLDPSENPSRILIMDTNDKATATNVIQLNKNGIGFSTDGIDGTYRNAWTIDGNLVAEFITAQVLTGLAINNGNGTFSVDELGNVIAKALTIKGGSFDVNATSSSDSRFKLRYNEWTVSITPIGIEFINSMTKNKIVIQAGGIFFYNTSTGPEVLNAYIGTSSGNIIIKDASVAESLTAKNIITSGNVKIAENGDITTSGKVIIKGTSNRVEIDGDTLKGYDAVSGGNLKYTAFMSGGMTCDGVVNVDTLKVGGFSLPQKITDFENRISALEG